MIPRLDSRCVLWIGKWAFSKIDTHRTRVLYVQNQSTYRLPVPPRIGHMGVVDQTPSVVEVETISLNHFDYKSPKRRMAIWLGYSDKLDVLLVRDNSFRMELR